ncbi:LysR family transcriptional regulator [Nocardia sp. XZ_19_369]|uniref:helix-turn-helix domain-containing protein n=1 Tax=Nocardia sp. XZ_19_369 TaxID=2769487 RepID=UPI0027D23F0B|nr:LysR family transcriptional regulator [Nocardia sp. XZ_19_369]
MENGSIHGAAARLGYTPSAISQHIAALQRETGMPLVERHGRDIRPTEAGVRSASAVSARAISS